MVMSLVSDITDIQELARSLPRLDHQPWGGSRAPLWGRTSTFNMGGRGSSPHQGGHAHGVVFRAGAEDREVAGSKPGLV